MPRRRCRPPIPLSDLPAIDLTKVAADVPLPPADHPFWNGDIKSATDGFPDLNLTRQQMAAKIFTLEYQVARLARLLGVDPNEP